MTKQHLSTKLVWNFKSSPPCSQASWKNGFAASSALVKYPKVVVSHLEHFLKFEKAPFDDVVLHYQTLPSKNPCPRGSCVYGKMR